MANICEVPLTADFTQKCDEVIATGIEQKIVLILLKDIDKSAILSSPYKTGALPDITLLSGKTGIFVEGVSQENNFSTAITARETGRNGKMHTVVLSLSNPDRGELAQINSLTTNKTKVVAVVEMRNKGANQTKAFKVLGFDSGLLITENTESSIENGGNVVITLTSEESALEAGNALFLGENYATTKARFEAKFVPAP